MAPENRGEFIDKTVQIKRCAAVVKGGRRFSFAALVVVGDGKGKVGWGYGKANEVPPAVEKAQKQANRNMVSVQLVGADTIPHYVRAKYGAADVMLMPADAGTLLPFDADLQIGARRQLVEVVASDVGVQLELFGHLGGGDAGVVLDRHEQGHLAAGHSERVALAAQLPREAQEDGPQPSGNCHRIVNHANH